MEKMTWNHWPVIILLLLILTEEQYVQTEITAVINPRGYNATLDPEVTFTFQCDVTGADDVQWIVDGLPPSRQEIINRGILTETAVITVNEATGSFRQKLSISRNVANQNTTIVCEAESFTVNDVRSVPVVFSQIQGFLEAPSNLILTETESDDNPFMKRISWNEPFTLDITDAKLDISNYKVCYSLINSANKSQCTRVYQTEFTFLIVTISLEFTVYAVNVVGESNSSSILYEATVCNSSLSGLS